MENAGGQPSFSSLDVDIDHESLEAVVLNYGLVCEMGQPLLYKIDFWNAVIHHQCSFMFGGRPGTFGEQQAWETMITGQVFNGPKNVSSSY